MRANRATKADATHGLGTDSMIHQGSEGAAFATFQAVQAERGGVYARLGKRLFDLSLLLVLSPFALALVGALALLAKLDGGPAFYGQARVGRAGRIFTCWKIRTMVPDAEARLEECLRDPARRAEWDETQKLKDDPRVTRVGRFLRATSFDELPQLWNILRGEMSFVGPRPFTPDQTRLYPGLAYYALRPGLTGFWQVGDRNDVSFAARAVDDARYARELSLRTDLVTLARTAKVVLACTGR